MTRYEIRVGYPGSTPSPADPSFGWSLTLERAIARGRRLSRHIRSDCAIGVFCDDNLLAVSTTNHLPPHVRDLHSLPKET